MNEEFYWACCDGQEHKVESLAHARELLEIHEKEFHKGKQVGRFGKKRVKE
jgi:hypothetical protein